MTNPDARRGDRQAEWAQLGRKHIVVVDSDPAFLDLLRLLLQGERYNVTTTNCVPRTFNQIAALRPDLLIVNLSPRECSGWDLLERLHSEARTRHLPVVVTSTNPDSLAQAHEHRERYGAASYVALPFDVGALLGTSARSSARPSRTAIPPHRTATRPALEGGRARLPRHDGGGADEAGRARGDGPRVHDKQ